MLSLNILTLNIYLKAVPGNVGLIYLWALVTTNMSERGSKYRRYTSYDEQCEERMFTMYMVPVRSDAEVEVAPADTGIMS